MGWTIGWRSKQEVIEHVLKGHGEHLEVVDKSLAGNQLYVLYRNTTTGKRFIALYLLKGERVNRFDRMPNWGYKDMDEAMGPCYYDCPERLLAQSDCDSPYAIGWREACRQVRKNRAVNKAFLASLKPGDHFMFGESRVEYRGTMTRRGRTIYIGRSLKDGATYRYAQNRISPLPVTA